jgi:hypothetical protein
VLPARPPRAFRIDTGRSEKRAPETATRRPRPLATVGARHPAARPPNPVRAGIRARENLTRRLPGTPIPVASDALKRLLCSRCSLTVAGAAQASKDDRRPLTCFPFNLRSSWTAKAPEAECRSRELTEIARCGAADAITGRRRQDTCEHLLTARGATPTELPNHIQI